MLDRHNIELFMAFCQGLENCGAPSWNRTNDPLLKREMLYQLSYGCIYKSFLKLFLTSLY